MAARAKAGLAAAALLAAGAAQAEDWRAMPWPGPTLGLVDADSVRRRADGRISFTGRGFNTDSPTAREHGFDSYTVEVEGQCANTDTVRAKAKYFLAGKAVPPPRATEYYRPEHQGSLIAAYLCKGDIGFRSFRPPEAALVGFDGSKYAPRPSDYVSPELELTGRVVQGFEMNGIALCGSEEGCVEGAPWELCWFEGDVNVPLPAGANPESIRRDTLDVALKGRITRTRSGHGFGHVGAYGCRVEQTGPARKIEIAQRPPFEPGRGEIGRTPAALTAHAALEAAFADAGAVTFAQGGRSWSIDELKARPEDWEAACGSDLQFKGKSLEPYPTAIMWEKVAALDVAGRDLTIRTRGYDGNLEFRVATPAAARTLAAAIERAAAAKVASVEQRQRQVTLRTAAGGKLDETFPDAASAVEAAGILDRLRSREIVAVDQRDNRVTALPLRIVRMTFETEAKARQVSGLLEELRRACRAAPAAGS